MNFVPHNGTYAPGESAETNAIDRQNLWAHLHPQKKHNQRHINVQYNRAHVKNYTQFAFASSSAVHGKSLVIRRAIDDKAYVRCGTSDGFSRPLHTPVQLNTGPDSHF